MARVHLTTARLKRAIFRWRRDGFLFISPGAGGRVQAILAATRGHGALVRVKFTRRFLYIPFPRFWEAGGTRYIEMAVPQADLEMKTNGRH